MEILKFALILNFMSERLGQGDDSDILLSLLKLLKWNSFPLLFDVWLAQQSGISCGICQQVLL